MKFFKTLILAASVLALSNAPALAHSDEYLDTQSAPHGGQLRMAGPYHFELVLGKATSQALDQEVVVYVTDHAGSKLETAGANGSVLILSGKTKLKVTLSPAGENRLKGKGVFAVSSDMKSIVAITLAGKPTEQARFAAAHAH